MYYSKKNQNGTNKGEVEEKNKEGEEIYRCLFEQATDLIIVHDMNGLIVDVNGSLCSRLGFTKEELLKMNFRDLFDPAQLKEFPPRFKEVAEGKHMFSERRYVCKDGSFVEIEANVKKMSNNLILGVCRDVTERKKMERELREAELKFRTLSEKSLVGIYIIQDGKFAYVNPKFAEICGYPQQDLINSYPVEVVVDPEDHEMVRENIRARIEGEIESLHFEVRGRKRDGSLVYAEVFGNRSNYQGKPAIVGTLIDITERKIAEEQILKEKKLSNEIIDCLPGIFVLQDDQGRYLRWNKQFGKETGYSDEEIKNLDPFDLLSGFEKEETRKGFQQIFLDPSWETDLEIEILSKQGKKKPFYLKAKLIQYEGKTCFIGTGIDITELKRVERDLKKSEANLHTILDNTDTIYVLLDKNFKILSYNQRADDFVFRERHLKINVSDHFVDYFAPDRRIALSEWMKKVIAGEHISYEISYPKEDGSFTWYFARMFPVANDKEVLGIMLAVSDITERKLTEQKLQRSVEQLTYHINNTPLAVIEWDKDMKVIQWSKRAEEIFGWMASEALGKEMHNHIVYKTDIEKVKFHVDGLLSGRMVQNPHPNRNYSKGGEILHCEWYNSLLRDENGNVETILSLVRDVTEIRNAEEDLRRSFKEISDYKIALDESSIVGITDPQGLFIYVNDNFCNVSGFSKEELIGKDHRMLHTGSHSGEYIQNKWNKIGAGQVWRGEINNRTKTGSNFWVDMTIIPFLDEQGKPIRFMSISNDITRKKIMEQEILDQKVQEQKKITRAVIKAQERERNKIGQELHDNVNQILASSRMYLSLALNKKVITKELVEESTVLIESAIQEIRMLSRNQITPRGKLGLKELIQLLVDNLNENAFIQTRFEYEVASLPIDSDLKLNIYRIIQEQVNNILKHSQASNVNIRLSSNDEFINISVADDGKGFLPFKKRTGVGLTNMINRVESFNGEFSIESSPGKGCKLGIKIPM
jgi:PAS domain S-box-containing protein